MVENNVDRVGAVKGSCSGLDLRVLGCWIESLATLLIDELLACPFFYANECASQGGFSLHCGLITELPLQYGNYQIG